MAHQIVVDAILLIHGDDDRVDPLKCTMTIEAKNADISSLPFFHWRKGRARLEASLQLYLKSEGHRVPWILECVLELKVGQLKDQVERNRWRERDVCSACVVDSTSGFFERFVTIFEPAVPINARRTIRGCPSLSPAGSDGPS